MHKPHKRPPTHPGKRARWIALPIAAAIVSLATTACSTPKAAEPTLDVKLAEKFTEGSLPGQTASNDDWWARFDDVELSRLVQSALQSNHDVLIALQRVSEAQSGVTAQSSALLPSVDAQIATQRSSSGLPAPVKAAGQADVTGYQANLRLSWEIDLSGALRAARDAAKSDVVGAQAGVVGAKLEVASEVARQYFIYRSAEQRLSILKQILEAQRSTEKLTADKFSQGQSSALELDLAESDVSSIESQIPPLQSLCAVTQSKIAVLLGADPSSKPVADQPNYAWPSSNAIASGQPADLLRRRPDLIASEAKFTSQSLRAIQARDQLWPKLFVGALFGSEGLTLNSLNLSPVRYQNVASAFMMPIFNAGRIRAISDGQDAEAKAALMQWQQNVLVAVQEVESSLAVKKSEDQRAHSIDDELKQRRSALKHARALFTEGQVSKLTVLQMQRAELSAEIDLTDSAERRMLSNVQLYKALGGGWPIDPVGTASSTSASK